MSISETEEKILNLAKDILKPFDRDEMTRLINQQNRYLEELKQQLVENLKKVGVTIEKDTFDPVLYTIIHTILDSDYYSKDSLIDKLKLDILMSRDANLFNITHNYDGEKFTPNYDKINELKKQGTKYADYIDKYISNVNK
jgi:hypothetical protein